MKSYAYIAILGRQPELGLVELESRLGAEAMEPYGRGAALLESALPLDELGGVLKLGRVLYDGPATDLANVSLDDLELPPHEGKRTFGVSMYGLKATKAFVLATGLTLKKALKRYGSLRLVPPTEGTTLSAAQLRHNHVLERGFELLMVVTGQRMVVAQTLEVQDIDWYSRRDYERPARSAKVGMLPPKLAQVLVNTTTAPVVADPFCGTGVVPQEALLMGRSAVGSDLSPEMVDATRMNLAWLENVAPRSLEACSVELADAREVELPAGCAVVSEGYLGPNLMRSPAPEQLQQIRAELLPLYQDALANWARQLAPGADVALCVPAWRTPAGWKYLGVVDDVARLGYTIKVFKHVPRDVLYARHDQFVGRQLLLLRKN